MTQRGRTKHGTGSKVLRPSKSRYVPALDGLRAFSVLAVIFYHMGLSWAPGGLMGVTVFFVISGYLITGLLVAEFEGTGRISLAGFWLRRVRRIIPAVVLAIAGTLALCAALSPALLDKALPDVAPSLLFYNNWWQIFRDVSYFDAAGAPSPLMHYWSLAIEEQFYIVWPLLLVGFFRAGAKRKPLALVVALLAAMSALLMAALYDPHGDPSRAYYGTDTRAMSLLVGAWLALVWPSSAFGGRPRPQTAGASARLLDAVGVAAALGLIAIVAFTNGFSAFPYLGGIALTSVLSAALIAALVHPGTWMTRLLQIRPLVWVGKRSYGMYLWHLPVILLTSRIDMPVEVPWWVHTAQLVVIFAVSDLSFRFVEDPIRKGKLGAWMHSLDLPSRRAKMAESLENVWDGALPKAVGAFAVCVVVGGGALALIQHAGPNTQAAQGPPSDATPEASSGETPAKTHADAREPQGDAVSQLAAKLAPVVNKQVEAERKRLEKQAVERAYDELFYQRHENRQGLQIYEPLLIGDSVPAGAADLFPETFPNGHIDAVVGRNIWESPYEDYLQTHQVGTYVIFCLGTNNAVTDEQVDELLAPVADDKKVILVNTRSTYFDWADVTNKALADAPARHPNVVAVLDWHAFSENHGEYFWDDATHLRPEGARAYLSLIEEAVRQSVEHDTSESYQ